MSLKSRLKTPLGVLIGAQLAAAAALAQTPAQNPQPATRAQEAQEATAPSTATQSTRDPATTRDSDATRSQSGSTTTDHSRMDHSKSADAAKMKPVTAQSFASQAAVIGKAEIELAQLALNNTKNEEIRIYAERMVKDHTAADQKLKKIAATENLQLPQSLDAKHQALKQKLSGLQGDAFDREYKKHMTMGHGEAVALFESAAQTQQMPKDLKEFAASTLPTLEKHHEMAKDLDTKEGA
jgi:putative membrane protein